ncbi:hypothetical protein KMC60_gp33 [Achromobacter phage vB_AxyP_19-32_Axy11]|uniref:Uncharacterized protein n=2 Tax=Pourcelvirus TaxID=2842976 RepID=A0A514CUB7_9CAUD|nr:hypothetical protein KMC59_gp34 [Achromobacter phage vB_AxyP_19-32_Axy10]YP_010079404.1 hypothetical protein KMC60_gp33 [Achromobacter phage vB_AxyP_19-32_Axy11]QDH83994.1 hypothetical protein Axy10_034 [Achromobacter phage vB_AxyP_19-32_Axy10]QDH84074.1 hypothetical protein Axy11_033 [Achromobacter phage vB_AxyP_19-32_Axy11]
MLFGFLKLFKPIISSLVPIDQMVVRTEMRQEVHAALPKSSNRVRRPEQDDYG